LVATFPYLVVTPERVVAAGEAEMLTLRAEGGDIAYLAGHVPFVGEVAVTALRVVHEGGEVREMAVHRGFVEVAGGEVVVAAEAAELPEEIDRERAERARAAAAADPSDPASAEALARAELRLELAGRAPRGAPPPG
jgi:F-type H+-transporting ATPase subunit epsilon